MPVDGADDEGRAPDGGVADERARLEELVVGERISYWRLLGIRLEDVAVGRVRLRLPMTPDLGTFGGDRMHGGAIASAIDAATASATRTLRGPDEPRWRSLATTDLNVSYLEAASGDVVVDAEVLRSGRSMAFVRAEVHDDAGRLVAVGRASLAIRRAD